MSVKFRPHYESALRHIEELQAKAPPGKVVSGLMLFWLISNANMLDAEWDVNCRKPEKDWL